MTTIEVGALGRLIDACRKGGDVLPESVDEIYTLCHCRDGRERATVLAMLRRFFERQADGTHIPAEEVVQ